jgi:Putative beta-barrel porin-2, OmpL-like. bbp2
MAGSETDDTTVFPISQPLPFTPTVSNMANDHWRQLIDTTVAYAVTPKITLQTNFDYGRGDVVPGISHPVWWTGSANYVRYVFMPRTSFTARYEYYLDHDGFTTGTAQHVNEATGTLERRFGQSHVISRAEFRRDMSNQPVFFNSLGFPTLKDQNTFTVGLIYTIQKSE